MAKTRTLTHIEALEKWDIIEVPARTLNMKGEYKVPVFVAEIFYGNDNAVEDLLVYPLVSPSVAKEEFGFVKPVELSQPAAANLPAGSVLVPIPVTVRNNLGSLHMLGSSRSSRFDNDREGIVMRVGAFNPVSEDIEKILSVTEQRDDRPQSKGGPRTQNWDLLMSEVGSRSKRESDNETEALRSKRVYAKRKPDAKKPGRKKENVKDVLVTDLTLDEVVTVFNPSEGLKNLFNSLAARPEMKDMTLRQLEKIAIEKPHALETATAVAINPTLESVVKLGLVKNGGYIGSEQLMKFLNITLQEGKIENFGDLAALAAKDRKTFYALPGIGPRNVTPLSEELAATQKRLEAGAEKGPGVDVAGLTRELTTIRKQFMSEALAIATNGASPDIKEKYQTPESKAPGETPRYFHIKVVPQT